LMFICRYVCISISKCKVLNTKPRASFPYFLFTNLSNFGFPILSYHIHIHVHVLLSCQLSIPRFKPSLCSGPKAKPRKLHSICIREHRGKRYIIWHTKDSRLLCQWIFNRVTGPNFVHVQLQSNISPWFQFNWSRSIGCIPAFEYGTHTEIFIYYA
jgi:hypothetical protein